MATVRVFIITLPALLFAISFLHLPEGHSVTASALPQEGVSAQQQTVEFVGQIGGAAYAVAIQGNYAYVGIGSHMLVFGTLGSIEWWSILRMRILRRRVPMG